jgi:hypothetical protein
VTGISNASEVFARIADGVQKQQAKSEDALLTAVRTQWQTFGEIRDKRLLEQIGFASEELFSALVAEHPAAELAASVDNVHRGYALLESAKNILVGVAGRLHFQLLHSPLGKVNLDEILTAATKEVFTYAAATEALVQGYRHATSCSPALASRYDKIRGEHLDGDLARFFKALRNSNSHIEIVEASPHYTIRSDFSEGSSSVQSGLSFNRHAILNGEKGSQRSKEIASTEKRLDVMDLVAKHFTMATKIYSRFCAHAGVHADIGLRDLNRIKVARKSISLRMSLGLLLQVAIPKKLDPYEYLSRWFTSEELDRAYCLPDRTQAQVDYLISLRDPLGLCDGRTRSRLYELFSVD